MTYQTQQKNTRWQSDSTGAYIEFEQGNTNMDVSINFENLLNTGEYIEAMTITSEATVAQHGPFWLDPVSKRLILAVIQFAEFTETGIYPVDFTVTTNQNRTYRRHFRVKIV